MQPRDCVKNLRARLLEEKRKVESLRMEIYRLDREIKGLVEASNGKPLSKSEKACLTYREPLFMRGDL